MPTDDEIAQQIAGEQRGLPSSSSFKPEQPGVADVPKVGFQPSADDELARQIRDEQVKQDQQQGNLLSWRAANTNVDAGVQADVLRYSAASGLAPSFVEKNLDQVKKDVDAKGTDWNQVAVRQPALVQFMLEQPEMMPLVKDDAAQLGGIEWALKAPFHAFLDAIGEQGTVALQFGLYSGDKADGDLAARIKEREAKYSNKDYGADSVLQRALIGTARMLPFLAGDVAARAYGGLVGGATGAGAGGAGGAAAGAPAAGVGAVPGAAAGASAGGITGAAVGQFIGSALFNYYESVGPLYWRLANLKDANGKTMDPTVARAFATGGAVVTAGLMAGLMGKVGGQLPGVKQLLQKFGANTVEKVLLEQTTSRGGDRRREEVRHALAHRRHHDGGAERAHRRRPRSRRSRTPAGSRCSGRTCSRRRSAASSRASPTCCCSRRSARAARC
jgi:hypothetical protein